MNFVNYGEVTWVDVNTNFGEDVDPELVVDVESINNSLFNLMTCPIGTRPFERDYGCELIQALFEPADSQTAQFLSLTLFQAIRRWEPRIVLDRARSMVEQSKDGQGFDITIAYTIVRTKQNSTYSFQARRTL
jgi:phage baseplate assembly protein W